MFMQIIPSYKVLIYPNGHGDSIFRVPEGDLTSFINVLKFTGVKDYRITLEDPFGPDDPGDVE